MQQDLEKYNGTQLQITLSAFSYRPPQTIYNEFDKVNLFFIFHHINH